MIQFQILSQVFFIVVPAARVSHGKFLSLAFLQASALGEACHALWLTGRQDEALQLTPAQLYSISCWLCAQEEVAKTLFICNKCCHPWL